MTRALTALQGVCLFAEAGLGHEMLRTAAPPLRTMQTIQHWESGGGDRGRAGIEAVDLKTLAPSSHHLESGPISELAGRSGLTNLLGVMTTSVWPERNFGVYSKKVSK